MESGFSKWIGVALLLVFGWSAAEAQYTVKATPLTHDVKDLSQRDSKVLDQNGERCALIIFETPIPKLFSFNLGTLNYEKRQNKDDEIWIWVSADVKKMTIKCTDCTQLKDYRVSLKGGNVYRAKLTTGLPQETATVQNVQLYCEHTPFFVSIDGAAPVESTGNTYHAELPIGVHDLTVSAKLYKTYSGSFRLTRAKAYSDTIRLENNYGEVFFSVQPTNYRVYVNDEPVEFTRSLKLEPGQYKVSVRKDRYESFDATLTITNRDQQLVKTTLNPAFAVFTVTAAEEETEIWIDGRNKGHLRSSVELGWGEHTIEGRREGYDTWELSTKEFNASTPRTIKIPKLNRQYGGMRISVYPPEASIYVDGKLVNSESGVYVDPHMTTGPHFVQARMTDYSTQRDSFHVESGKMFVQDYVLRPIPQGRVTITTDPEIGIYRYSNEVGQFIFLSHTTYTGKLAAGENIIELRDLSGNSCQYKLFINDKQEHEPVTYPFVRKLMIRKNVAGGEVKLKPENYPAYTIKANKKIKLPPTKYEVTVSKRGYAPYADTIDLSDPNTPSLIHRADLHRLTDTTEHKPRKRNEHLWRFYDNAGRWYIGVIDFGYTFDFNGQLTDPKKFGHLVTFGVLPIRYKMFGVNLVDFEVGVTDSLPGSSFAYRPSVSLYVPCDHGFAFRFYGGFNFNLYDATHNTTQKDVARRYVFGGASMRFNYIGKFPMDIFAEYKWPIKGVNTDLISQKELLFRVGISFSAGVDL